MSPQIVRVLLNLYIGIQSAVYATFLILLIKEIKIFISVAALGLMALSFSFVASLITYFLLALYLLVLIVGPFSVIATVKIKKQKALSKWYKFSIISFPISALIVTLTYSIFMIWIIIQQH
jgi:hypothetical protein